MKVLEQRTAPAGVAGKPVRTVAVIPHTHWDREWYGSFQAFRLRLVDLLDQLLPLLEDDPGYTHFLLDGQMAMIDDYLAVRPEAAPRLRRLAGAGRLAIGPWYVLMDEFLVSGETIVRNLQLGADRAAALGGAMTVGYLPDMFGHVAQMPQLLRSAGFDHAVVWRGVPAAVDRTGFWWSAPDGSTVRAEYLRVGYGNGAAMPDDATALIRRVAAHEAELGPFLAGPDALMLWLAGSDHQLPAPWLGRVVAEANAGQDDYRLEVLSLPEYLDRAPTEGLPAWTGELRSGARANLLMGVASNRVDVRQAAARVERALERQAEPLCALWLPAGQWPAALLDAAWLEVIRNSAHDSICACSADEVGLAVLHRFTEALAIADGLRQRAVTAAAASLAAAGPVVVNPSARAAAGLVELTVAGETPVEGAQVLASVPAATFDVTGRGADLASLLDRLTAAGHLAEGGITGVDLRCSDAVEVTLTTGPVAPAGGGRAGHAPVAPALAEMWAQAGARRDQPLTVRVEQRPWQRVLVRVSEVPGFGWASWTPGPLTVPPVTAEATSLTNGLVHLEVDTRDGTFALGRGGERAPGGSSGDVAGLGRLVDDGDEGDTYNYSPPAADTVIDRPIDVAVEVVEPGPLRAVLRVVSRYRWPERVAAGRRVGERPVEVTTDLELRAGEDLVRVTTALDNQCRDHRLRAWFPLPAPARESLAECAFGLVTRGLAAEGGPHELGLPTFPSRRFVSAGGHTVTHEGLPEYELVDDGRALALTLLRATGMLSRDGMRYRPNAAGPALAVEGPQMIGRQVLRYCLHLGPGPGGGADPASDADRLYALADQAWLPLEVAEAPGGGHRPVRGSLLTVTGAEVSALHRAGGTLELRVFNPSDQPTTVTVPGRAGWLVDLLGRPGQEFDGSFPLGPRAIATARIRSAAEGDGAGDGAGGGR